MLTRYPLCRCYFLRSRKCLGIQAKRRQFPFAVTYTEQKIGADFVTDVGVSNFLIVLQ
jgi:hypothetical protein